MLTSFTIIANEVILTRTHKHPTHNTVQQWYLIKNVALSECKFFLCGFRIFQVTVAGGVSHSYKQPLGVANKVVNKA